MRMRTTLNVHTLILSAVFCLLFASTFSITGKVSIRDQIQTL